MGLNLSESSAVQVLCDAFLERPAMLPRHEVDEESVREALAVLARGAVARLQAGWTEERVRNARWLNLIGPPYHVVQFDGDGGWAVQHPLACRPDLLACEVWRAALADADGVIAGQVSWVEVSRARLDLIGEGHLVLTPIEQEVAGG